MDAKKIILCFGVSLLACVVIKKLTSSEETSNVTGKEDNKSSKDEFSNIQKWVYSIEDGKEYCRWYDRYGKNTVTYNTKCNRNQANMYGNKKK